MNRFIFPRWANKVPFVIFGVIGPAVTAVAIAGTWYYGTNKHIEVGFEPTQPVDYSHKLHAGEMGMDCRYCHFTAERSAMAAVPPTETCMNCHWKVRTDSLKLLPIRESYAENLPVKQKLEPGETEKDRKVGWVRVHNLPDYVYFNHSAHLSAGVGCASCHGRVDWMVKVRQVEPLSMGWCLECHRDPAPHVRPPGVSVTDMDWKFDGKPNLSKDGRVMAQTGREVDPPTFCSGCHR
jgi:hypothetical protein